MPACAVFTCKNSNHSTKGTDIKYFGFPKDDDVCKQWIVACGRKDKINLKYGKTFIASRVVIFNYQKLLSATVCSKHFDENCFEIPLIQRLLNYCPKKARNLKPDAVPNVNLPGASDAYQIKNVQKDHYEEEERNSK